MQQRGIMLASVILIFALIFCHSEQAEAKKKVIEKPLKQEWSKRTEEFSYETVTIVKGRTYTLKELIKPVSQYKSILYDLDEKLNKGYKITISGKELLINKKAISGKKPLVKKKTLRADETGEYWLKVKLKDSFHLFRVKVVEKYFNVAESEVAKIVVSDYVMGESAYLEITDPFCINQIVSKLVNARYVFVSPRVGSLCKTSRYSVGLYRGDGAYIAGFEILPDQVAGSWCLRNAENVSEARECYDYIIKLFHDTLLQIPKRSWE